MLLAAPASADNAAPAQPAAAAAKPRLDVNGDGHSDLMYRGLDGVLYVRTSANIAYPYTIRSTDTTEMPKDIIAPGDLDGSGSPEILTLSASGTLSLFESAGEESTGKVRWSGTGWQKYNKVVSPGDLNGDGRGDLLARTPSGDLYAYTSTGKVDSAPFEPAVKVGYGWGSYDQIVGLSDANGDGLGDVVARTTGGDLYFYAATGDPAKPLKKRVKAGYGFDMYNQLVAAEDINGDGRGDLMARTQNGDVYTYRSNGYGGFRYRVADTFGWNKAAQFVGAGGNPDYGKHELEARTNAGYLWWYQSKNNGQFAPRTSGNENGEPSGGGNLGMRGLASSFDNDGQADQLWVYQGQLFAGGNFIGLGWQVYDSLTGPGDVSGDGKGDLLARDTKGDLYLYKGNGLGTKFAAKAKVGYGFGTYNKIVGAGDLSGDGIADVVARAKDGTLYLYKGTGNAAAPLKARVKIGTGFNIYNKFAAPGDVSGDGKADLVGVDAKGDLYRYTSTGTGKITKRVEIGYNFNIYNDLF